MKELIENQIKTLGITKEDFERFDLYYPKIKESVVPLSFTGVTPRNFFSWKRNGLIELSNEIDNDKRRRVKLNLIEYIWVKMIQAMRDFGLPYEIIRQVKLSVFCDIINQVIYGWDALEDQLRTVLFYDDAKISELKKEYDIMVFMFQELIENGLLSEEEKTCLYQIVVNTIFHNALVSIVIIKQDYGFHVDLVVFDKFENKRDIFGMALAKPHFQIPISNIIKDFFNEPNSEKYAERLGFFNPKEMKVLDAIRKRDFIEIQIKLDKNKDYQLEIIKDGTISDEQAKHIRKVLGLGQYEEITLKYRNDKNLYFRNKKKI